MHADILQDGLSGIFDSHCHYDDTAFDGDRAELLGDMLSADSPVSFLMHACTDLASAEYGIKAAEAYRNYYTSVGIHPENMENLDPEYAESCVRWRWKMLRSKQLARWGLIIITMGTTARRR